MPIQFQNSLNPFVMGLGSFWAGRRKQLLDNARYNSELNYKVGALWSGAASSGFSQGAEQLQQITARETQNNHAMQMQTAQGVIQRENAVALQDHTWDLAQERLGLEHRQALEKVQYAQTGMTNDQLEAARYQYNMENPTAPLSTPQFAERTAMQRFQSRQAVEDAAQLARMGLERGPTESDVAEISRINNQLAALQTAPVSPDMPLSMPQRVPEIAKLQRQLNTTMEASKNHVRPIKQPAPPPEVDKILKQGGTEVVDQNGVKVLRTVRNGRNGPEIVGKEITGESALPLPPPFQFNPQAGTPIEQQYIEYKQQWAKYNEYRDNYIQANTRTEPDGSRLIVQPDNKITYAPPPSHTGMDEEAKLRKQAVAELMPRAGSSQGPPSEQAIRNRMNEIERSMLGLPMRAVDTLPSRDATKFTEEDLAERGIPVIERRLKDGTRVMVRDLGNGRYERLD